MRETTHEDREFARSLAKGMLAGLIGGLVATAAKSVMEKIYPPRMPEKPEPPELVAERISHHAGYALTPTEKAVVAETIHWGFGALTGAAYGGLAEYFPAATAKDGATFGLTLATLTHGAALPAMGLAEATRERTREMTSYVVYGLLTERVRRFVRPRLG